LLFSATGYTDSAGPFKVKREEGEIPSRSRRCDRNEIHLPVYQVKTTAPAGCCPSSSRSEKVWAFYLKNKALIFRKGGGQGFFVRDNFGCLVKDTK